MIHPKPLNCQATRRLMYGGAPTERKLRAHLEAHTAVCPDCAAEWHELQTVTRWVGRYPVPEPDEHYWQHLAAMIITQTRRRNLRSGLGIRFPPSLPVTASVLIGALGLFFAGLMAGQHWFPPAGTETAPPSIPAGQKEVVPISVPVPVVVVKTERDGEIKVGPLWREQALPVYLTPKSSGSQGKTSPPASPSPSAVSAASVIPQVERNEFREYIVRRLPEPALLPAHARMPRGNADTVVGEPQAIPAASSAGTLVAPVRVLEVQAWPTPKTF